MLTGAYFSGNESLIHFVCYFASVAEGRVGG